MHKFFKWTGFLNGLYAKVTSQHNLLDVVPYKNQNIGLYVQLDILNTLYITLSL